MELDEEVMELVDDKINDLLDEVVDTFPDQEIGPELFICLQQVAVEIAVRGGITEKEFLDAARKTWALVKAETKVEQDLKSMN